MLISSRCSTRLFVADWSWSPIDDDDDDAADDADDPFVESWPPVTSSAPETLFGGPPSCRCGIHNHEGDTG